MPLATSDLTGKEFETFIDVKRMKSFFQERLPEFSKRKQIITDCRVLFTPDFGDALVHLPDLEMIVWAFPNDPKISQLPMVTNPEKVKPYLPFDGLPDKIQNPSDLSKVEREIVRYKPEERCTTSFQLHYGSVIKPEEIVIFGKYFKDHRG